MPEPPRYCVECRYDCTALPRDRACPECGHAAPPGDAIVVQGYSFARNPALWLILLAVFMVFTAGSVVAAFVGSTRSVPVFSFVTNIVILLPLGLRAFYAARLYRQGGDITWFVEPTGLDVIAPSDTRTIRWSDFEYVTIERGGARHLARLSIFGGAAATASVWLDERHYDIYALRALLRARVADARAAAGLPPPAEPSKTPDFARYKPERPTTPRR
ncbi:MAG: hypothetical protein JNM94_12330 [Phycisphaerae bacterium]|nr:hypothetical protein [Phycisphaerae bacterium]